MAATVTAEEKGMGLVYVFLGGVPAVVQGLGASTGKTFDKVRRRASQARVEAKLPGYREYVERNKDFKRGGPYQLGQIVDLRK